MSFPLDEIRLVLMEKLTGISNAALALDIDERTILANRLAESLHAESDSDLSEAWTQEIRRRIDDVRSGRVKTVDGPEGLARVRSLVRK